jgi:signal transduction histidine kinase
VKAIIRERPELQPPRADVRIESPLPRVLGHRALLTQCFSNLLGNAVKYVAPHVQPRIRLWAEVVDSGELMVHRPPGYQPSTINHQLDQGHQLSTINPQPVRVWVEDNGIGIEKEFQERIFGLFERHAPSPEYPGTGVGLAIVRKAAERMGGTVGVESAPGQGSRFWVELSRAE